MLLAQHFSHAYDINIADNTSRQVHGAISDALHVYVSRITSLAAMIALAQGTRKVSDKQVAAVRGILYSPRRKMQGGTVMAGDYFGYPHTAYGMGNLDTNTTTIDFGNGSARPEIGMSGGGSHSCLLRMIQENLAMYKVTASVSASTMLRQLVSEHLDALALALKTSSKTSPLTTTKLHTTLRAKKFALFR